MKSAGGMLLISYFNPHIHCVDLEVLNSDLLDILLHVTYVGLFAWAAPPRSMRGTMYPPLLESVGYKEVQ